MICSSAFSVKRRDDENKKEDSGIDIFLSLNLYSQDFLSLHKIDSVESVSKCYAINPYEFQKKQISSNEILNSCTSKVISWAKLSLHSKSELLDVAEEVKPLDL